MNAWAQYDSGWTTGRARARHDLAISPMTAIAFDALARGPYGHPPVSRWDHGYVAGYHATVLRWLR